MSTHNVLIRPRSVRSSWMGVLSAAVLLAMGVLLAWLAFPGQARADAGLQVEIEAGYQGRYKETAWFPVTFTITNPGEDISGELAVQVASFTQSRDVVYTLQVDLPAGTTQQVSMALPGMAMGERNNRVSFYEGNAATGRKAEIAGGDPYISVSPISGETFLVGILARDPDTMNFLALLNQQGYSVSTVVLGLESGFNDSYMLDGFDAIVINDIAESLWNPDQVEAVARWVDKGGTLILAGGAGYDKIPDPLQDLSPVDVFGTTVVSGLDSLAELTETELQLSGSLTVSNGAARDGARVIHAEEGVPITAVSRVGSGRVLYAAYDLSLQPLASWQGNPGLWQSLMGGQISLPNTGRYWNNNSVLAGSNYWGINNALDQFSSFELPSQGLLLIVLLIYAAVVGPAVYMTLKRWGKREWAWLIVPGFAVVASLGIYGIGASQRNETLAQMMTLVELNGRGQALERSAASVFVPRGGTYEFEKKGSSYAITLGTGDFNYNSSVEMSGNSDTFIQQGTLSAAMTFTGVPYWSVRKGWYYDEVPREAGSIDYQLTETGNGTWEGQFTNHTGVDLVSVLLLLDGQWLELGDLIAGESVVDSNMRVPTVSGSSSGQTLSPNVAVVPGNLMYPNQFYRGINNNSENALFQAFWEELQSMSYVPTLIVGWSTHTDNSSLSVNGRSVQAEEIRLWVQPLNPERREGGELNDSDPGVN